MTSSQLLKDLTKKIIRGEYNHIDPKINEYLDLLSQRGADECWHKCGTFKEHLLHFWRICKLWDQPDEICRLGLFHSAYSNCYVNLAIFDRGTQREYLSERIGTEAEDLTYLFCVIPRQTLIFDVVLKQNKIPEEGVKVNHIITGESIHLSPYICAVFVISTIADFVDQWFHWQDSMTANNDALMPFSNFDSGFLWPGDGRPGLILSFANRLGRILLEAKEKGLPQLDKIVIPPIFNYCKDTLEPKDEKTARDNYWKVVTEHSSSADSEKALQLLKESTQLNPHFAEPHISLAQIYVQHKEWELAKQHAKVAIDILQIWGCALDKRMSWEAWISWSRVIYQQAEEKSWPNTPLGMLGLGLVK